MKMAFIAPYKELVHLVEDMSKKMEIALDVFEGAFESGVQMAMELERKGYEIIISRGATSSLIANRVNVPVVNCGVTSFDILYAVEEASKFSNKIGLILYEPVSFDSQWISKLFNIELLYMTSYKNSSEVIQMVEEAIEQGVEVIIGGILTKQHVESLGKRGVILKTAPETINQAIQSAVEIIHLSRQQMLEAERVKQIINFAHEGIIVTDEAGHVTVFNPAAEKLMGIKEEKIIGNRADLFIPTTGLIDVLSTGERQIGEVQKHKNSTIITNRIPIKIKDKVQGVVATFQDISYIQDIEMKIRSEIYQKGLVAKYTLDHYIGQSDSVKKLISKAKRFAASDSTVLIHGESGTGKEILAQGIHNVSSRRNGPFVAVNCSAIPEHLLESELFGYDEGAFTGAKKGGKMGLFELAHKGTIFLDEIGSISKNLQASLLRVLQEKEVWRVGSNRVIQIDVRIIAATNNNLFEAVEKDLFRKDLYYRLNILKLQTSPLRMRREDIVGLVRHFMAGESFDITPDFVKMLTAYYWPGNVRELQNFIERLILLKDDMLVEEIFNDFIDNPLDFERKQSADDSEECMMIRKATFKEMEREIILQMYRENGENMTLVAEKLGMSRTTIWKRLKEYEVFNM
ncbi:PAS domain S-box-containing protein [Anaerosolibacter carboniphilus]|uniref:PAS domain S-box-containing protein n=1 Tax=Anaerosolibacter carboniphilus TaxID=1417629 RepID=A0A841KUR3_9FIRM|nr:sigma 54-interacting transcriptional regulator [Anaerosolibacter carboniphilus]MBB6215750.1 PAS domain S-box-containing protein [Anaerosolibacter carboniphilus]